MGSTATAEVHFSKGQYKTQYTDQESSEIQIFQNEKVNIFYKSAKAFICGEGTLDEMKEIRSGHVSLNKKDLKIEYTGKTDVIAGYICNEAIVSYKYEYKLLGKLLEHENHIWFAKDLKMKEEFLTNNVDDLWASSNYLDTLKKIEGFVLKQEIFINGDKTGLALVTEFDDEKIEQDFFISNTKDCKKIYSLKQCIRRINSYRNAKDSFDRMSER